MNLIRDFICFHHSQRHHSVYVYGQICFQFALEFGSFCPVCFHTSSDTACICSLLAAVAKGISEVEPSVIAQNGAPPGKKSTTVPLPELEYREKARDSTGKEREGKKQNTIGINNNSIIHALDSKLQETEYIENYAVAKRLNNDLAGENTLADTNTHSTSKEEMGGTGKNYKNTSGGGGNISNSSPRNHSSSNGSVPPGSSTSKNEKKQKGAGKGQKDPVENCIPNNQLGKPDALIR